MATYGFYQKGVRPPVVGIGISGEPYSINNFDKMDESLQKKVFESIIKVNKWPLNAHVEARPKQWGFPTIEYYIQAQDGKAIVVVVPEYSIKVVPSPSRVNVTRIPSRPIIPTLQSTLYQPNRIETISRGKPSSAAISSKEEVDYYDEPQILPPIRYVPKKKYPPVEPPVYRTEKEYIDEFMEQ